MSLIKKTGKKKSRHSEKAMNHANVLGAGAKARAHIKDPETKIATVQKEFKNKTLHSGSGAIVKNPKQAIAIALSEARKSGAHIPKKGK